MADVAEALRTVVLPAVEAVFRDGELSSIQVRVEDDSVRLVLTAHGEIYSDVIVQAGVSAQSSAQWRERLRSNLVDFVAESRFGWGQSRDETSL
jgi:hypothetical protein